MSIRSSLQSAAVNRKSFAAIESQEENKVYKIKTGDSISQHDEVATSIKTESIPLTEKSASSEIESDEDYAQQSDDLSAEREEEVKIPVEVVPL